MLETSIRTLASLLFAVIIFVSFLGFLTASKVKSTLLEPTFYTDVLKENDSYRTIHTGLLSEIGESEEVNQLREDIGMDRDEFDSLANEVVPLPYLEAQVNGIIFGVMSYLRGDVEEPQVFIELSQPIESMRRVSLDFVDRRVDSVEQTHPTTAEEYAREARNVIEYLESGEIPPTVPSLASVPQPVLESALDQVVPVLSYLDPQTAASLESQWDQVRSLALQQPESTEAMKAAGRAVVSPYIDEAIAEVRVHLDDQDRFDLVEAAAEASELSRQEFLVDLDSIRDPINSVHSVGPVVALVVMVVATALLALVNVPHRASMMIWPGVTLLVTGILAIIISALLTSLVPVASTEICGDVADFACQPAVDLLLELSRAMSSFPIWPSIVLVLIGIVTLVAAVFVATISPRGLGSGPSQATGAPPQEGW